MSNSRLKVVEPTECFYNNHVTFTSVLSIQKIAEKLKQIDLSYFTFDRTYQDGSHLRLTNAGKWIEHYYRQKLYDIAIFEKNPKLFCDGYVLWDWLSRAPVYSAASEHNIDHGLTITQPHVDYCDFFHFGTESNAIMPAEKLIGNLPFLYRFIVYFKDKARNIIKEAEATRFILPIAQQSYFTLADIHHDKFFLDLDCHESITRLYLGDEFGNVYLTASEIKILNLLAKDKTAAQIAHEIPLSVRTVETHIRNIKEKLQCGTLFELGYITRALGITKLFSATDDAH